jgi:hypothetical protein
MALPLKLLLPDRVTKRSIAPAGRVGAWRLR